MQAATIAAYGAPSADADRSAPQRLHQQHPVGARARPAVVDHGAPRGLAVAAALVEAAGVGVGVGDDEAEAAQAGLVRKGIGECQQSRAVALAALLGIGGQY